MALSPSLLGCVSTISLHTTCAATLPAIGVLQSSLTHQTWPCARFSTSTPLRAQPPSESLPATCSHHPSLSTSSTILATPCSSASWAKQRNLSSAPVHRLACSTWCFGGKSTGKSWRFFSSGSSGYGFRSFSATSILHENDSEAKGPILPGGTKHNSTRDTNQRVQNALHILQHGNVLTLRQMLNDKAETNFHTTYGELLQMAKSSGAAHTQAEAEELAEALSRSGVVMRYRNIVYLRPQEVADMVIKALPDSHVEAEERVQEIDAELEAMKEKIQQVDRTAIRWTRVWLWGGCGLLAVQLAAFIRLTWWELSWDVMEPFAYVIGLGNTLIGYIYFMIFRNNLDYKPFEDYWKKQRKSKAAIEHRVDLQRYEDLLKLRARYVQHAAAISADINKPAAVSAN